MGFTSLKTYLFPFLHFSFSTIALPYLPIPPFTPLPLHPSPPLTSVPSSTSSLPPSPIHYFCSSLLHIALHSLYFPFIHLSIPCQCPLLHFFPSSPHHYYCPSVPPHCPPLILLPLHPPRQYLLHFFPSLSLLLPFTTSTLPSPALHSFHFPSIHPSPLFPPPSLHSPPHCPIAVPFDMTLVLFVSCLCQL